MASKRDLVEAHAFNRRRLVTALVSGAPGGREVEPVRPGRTIVGGVALGVLLLAGAAVNGVLADRSDVDPDKPVPVISQGKGPGARPRTEAARETSAPRRGSLQVARSRTLRA